MISGVAVGAGSFLGPPAPARTATPLQGKQCFVAQSTADRAVSEDEYRAAITRLQRSGATVRVATEPAPHVITDTQAIAIDEWLLDRLTEAP